MLETRDARLVGTFGAENLRRLRASRVAVVGVGLLGGHVSRELGLLEVPQLLVDDDLVDPPNLTQALPACRIGHPKVEARAAQIAELSPKAPVHALHARVEDVGLGVFAAMDLIVGALDGRASRMRVAEIAQKVDAPWLDVAVDGSGEHLLATVSCYGRPGRDASCYACGRTKEDLAAIANEGRGPGCPTWRDPLARATPPTLTAPAFGSIAAGYAALCAVRILLGEAEELANTRLQIHADGRPSLRALSLRRSPRCVLPHRSLGPLRAAPAAVGALFAAATADLGAEPERLGLHHRVLVPALCCPTCGVTRPLPRVREAYSDDDVRCGCAPGAEMVPERMLDRLERADVEDLAEFRWRDLGFPAADVVTAETAAGAEAHYVIGGRAVHTAPSAGGTR